MSLAYNLRKLREQNQYSQAELARAVQVAQSTIAMYETGERVPNAYVLMRIANFLRVSCEELVGEQTSTEEIQMTEAEFLDAMRKKDAPERAAVTYSNGDIWHYHRRENGGWDIHPEEKTEREGEGAGT